jgi:SPP1 family predicted phage head-tail adaptor
VNIGALRHRVQIEEKTRAPTLTGGSDETWGTIKERWAEVRPARSGEILAADALGLRTQILVVIRHDPTVRAHMRLVHNGRVLTITGVRHMLERQRWTILDCVEGQPS